MTETVATPKLEPTRKRRRGAISAVWLIPLIAVMLAGAIAFESYRNRGVEIAIVFPDASGVTPGETTLRFREVTVGVVEDVGFSTDLASVNVYLRVNREIAQYLDEDASFWIVQPEVTARGVEGLNTILSGTYIEGTWDSEIGTALTVFEGSDSPPIIPPGVEGTAIVLRAADSARLEAGAPILYRGIEVGEVAAPRLSRDGTEVRLDAFIRAPYDRQITTATRFWDASGISVGFSGSGVALDVGSLASILEGGVVFDTLVSGGQPIARGHIFDIFGDRDEALAATFEAPSQAAVRFAALFPGASAGLSEGAPVRYRGVRVGVVTSITGFVPPDDPGGAVQLLAVMALQPSRMGLETMENDLDGIDYVDDLVRQGMRAQLVSTSILGGSLTVDLVNIDDAGPAQLTIGVADNPLIPSVAGEESSLAGTAEGVLTRINELPIEELLISATDLMNNINRIAGDEDTRALPGAARTALEEGEGLVRDVRAIVSSPDTAGVLADVQRIADDIASLTTEIREREVATTLAETLDVAGEAAQNIAAGTQNLGTLTEQAEVLFDQAGRLISAEATQALPQAARDALDAGTQVLTSPEVARVLEDTAQITADIRTLTARIGTEAIATQVEAALANIDATARSVAEGTTDLAALRTVLDDTLAGARALITSADTQALPASVRSLSDTANDLINAPEIRALLRDLPVITQDIRAITAELREAQAALALTQALEAASEAAASVAAGTENLPALSSSAERVLAQAEVLAANLNTLTTKANALALDELVNSTTDLMQTADLFLSSDEAGDVPLVLSETLQELQRTIEEIRTGGTLTNLNTTLASAAGAADSVRIAAQDLPALVNRLQSLSVAATGVLTTYDSDSRIAQELAATLRAATRAAEDVSSLSRTIERNPNSLLLGR